MTAKNERFFVGPQLDTFPGDIIQKIHKAGVKILLGSDMEKAFHDDPLAMMDYIEDGFETICKLDIGESYKQNSILSAIFGKNDTDGLFLVTDDDENLVLGMLIVQKGECEALPKIWSLRLICSANFAYLVLPAGSYLMTLFVYQALVRREVGLILEVAGGIGENPGAACLYERFGFRLYEDLRGDDCFADNRNDPMMIRFDPKNRQADIDQLVDMYKNPSAYHAVSRECKVFESIRKEPEHKLRELAEEKKEEELEEYLTAKKVPQGSPRMLKQMATAAAGRHEAARGYETIMKAPERQYMLSKSKKTW